MSVGGRIQSQRVYSGRVINVDVDQVRFPDGSTGELEMVRHPGASAVVPFLGDPRGVAPEVLLIRQYRYAAEGYIYEIPAGTLDVGEIPAECARRELTEETGWSAARLDFLTTVYTTPGFTDEQIHLFLASGLTRGQSKRERDEFIQEEAMPFSRALEKIRLGEIRDAKTALGLLCAAAFLARP